MIKKKNLISSNVIIVIVLHLLFVGGAVFFASKEGMLGKKMQSLTVVLVPKPEPVKPVTVEKKSEIPVTSIPNKSVDVPRPAITDTPKIVNEQPSVAPSPSILPSMEFSDGAKEVITISDPIEIYKLYIENYYHSRWNRPDDINDSSFVVKARIDIDNDGNVLKVNYLNSSGDIAWDNSVKNVVEKIKTLGRTPPKGFPDHFIVQFDVIERENL